MSAVTLRGAFEEDTHKIRQCGAGGKRGRSHVRLRDELAYIDLDTWRTLPDSGKNGVALFGGWQAAFEDVAAAVSADAQRCGQPHAFQQAGEDLRQVPVLGPCFRAQVHVRRNANVFVDHLQIRA